MAPNRRIEDSSAEPFPSDLSETAPVYGDEEKGFGDSREGSRRAGSSGSLHKDESSPDGISGSKEERRSGRGKERAKHGKGLTEGDQDVEDLPDNNLVLVMPAIGLVLFLAALDMSIVATALPTIAEDLHASPSEYAWVGTSYTLAMTLQTPINGRVSDIIGRKPLVYAAIVIFLVFSALCGAAKNMTWLITARAFQGLGGGSIISMSNILVSDIVPLHQRPLYQGWLGGTWGIASVLGPILGGLLTTKASWRWTFYINLPTCGIALVLLIFTLKLNPTKKLTFSQLKQTFDFLGLLLIMSGGAILIVGFAQAADYGFDQPSSYALIIVGVILLAGAIVNFLTTKRNAIIPARIFKNRTTFFFLTGSMLQAVAFLPANYLLPQLFQGVRGSDALQSGIELLPFACTVAWSTVVAGQINTRLRIVRPVAWFGYGLAAIGFGMFYRFYRYPFSESLQLGLEAIVGVGIGLSLAVPIIILQAAMPLKEMAAATSAWSLSRSLGGSIGLAVFTAVLNSELRSRFAKIPGYGTEFQVPESISGYKALHDLPNGPTKDAVLGAFADSLGTCWLIDMGLLLAALLVSMWTKPQTASVTV
ncbi:major facilitator superfamily domain-containing protein [Kockovaella imperatae]|uniref:Major facilitator superfamily domain-containing protein n=1 Tax=Kockovaella imperatae TaxID=4999 RepID=A0A1Y1UK01_9TREE|nr:major facilitator superfamily domain-containing protein [Kockovaella imperatae]ORX37857.1 major facilitator superfamily domain-containing protein [Kockovaella imperatae]